MSKILVIGDSCKDKFVYCTSNRLCPDVPVPVLNVIDEQINDGMAMNFYNNLKSLGSNVDIVTNAEWQNVTKTRYVHRESNHMFIRIDGGHDTIKQIDLSTLSLRNYDIVAISDYDKGFISTVDIKYICDNHPLVFVDTKKILGDWIVGAKFIKINTPEFILSANYINDNIKSKIIKTCGENGCYYNNKNYSVKKVNVRDVSGAGDTFFAGLVYDYSLHNDIDSAIKFANRCASIVVQYKGVTSININMFN